MLHQAPSDIQQIIQILLAHGIKVTGPTSSDGKLVYSVNGHVLLEKEIRVLSQKHLFTSWDIFNYTRIRSAKRIA